MTWQLSVGANLVIGIAYLAIACIIFSGLFRMGQVTANRLGPGELRRKQPAKLRGGDALA